MILYDSDDKLCVASPTQVRLWDFVDGREDAEIWSSEEFSEDDKVKAVFINIFGGIVRCDMIAEGVIGAVKEVGVKVPVVVRLQGNNAELGAKVLGESGLNIIADTDLTGAAKKVVAAAANQ